MERKEIAANEFTCKPLEILSNQWMLLACGDFEKKEFNSMVVGWGAFGTMWRKPFCMIVVRPSRYTYDFVEKYDNFSLAVFPDEFKKKLGALGSKSGRELDKINDSGFTPIASSAVSSPGFDEAELILECKKMYQEDFDPSKFLCDNIDSSCYPDGDYHRMYFGEILAISGTDKYRV